MKNMLLSIVKKPIFYILIILICASILLIIRFTPHKLIKHIPIDNIESVYVDDCWKLKDENISDFIKMVENTKYTITYISTYKWTNMYEVRVKYKNGKIKTFNEHLIGKHIQVYETSFDFSLLIKMCETI